MPIYTRKGDKGETGLPGKRRLPKTDPLFEVLGTFDQLSATIGQAISQQDNHKARDVNVILRSIQSDLLSLGACLAAEKPSLAPTLTTLDRKITAFEQAIDQWESETGPLQNFILAGGSRCGAALHLARTVARQAERSYYLLSRPIEEISRYLNRLSDLLFQAARVVNFRDGQPEQIWKNPQNYQ
ncbi:MAG: cob(I)yrinic acid a,c-diamide adenosyltransferase [Patescibacteria group bacterium]